jgi:hypothetical protein
MALAGDADAVDGVMRITFGDRAVAVQWTGALVADTGDSNSSYREMSCSDARNFASVAGGVVQTDDVTHDSFSQLQDVAANGLAAITVMWRK